MNALGYIKGRFNLNFLAPLPIKIKPFSRNEFAVMLGILGMNTGAEIGVCGGRYSQVLCATNPNLKLYCIDPYSIDENNGNFVSQEVADGGYAIACKRLAPFDAKIIRKTSAEAVKDFKDESLDFVYLDGNHTYDYVLEDLNIWLPKIRIGGIISGHDYRTTNLIQVVEALDKFTKQNNIAPWFVFGSHIKPRIKSWMWVKQ